MELKGSQTEKNLWAAFAGESQAYTKYGYYASRAKKDGFEQISALFTETSGNEKEHAKISSRPSQRSRRSTRSAIVSCSQTSRMRRSSRRTRRSSGSAATAATSANRRRRRRSVPSAPIRRRILNSSRRIIDSARPVKRKAGLLHEMDVQQPRFLAV